MHTCVGALTVVVDGVEAGACRLAGAVTGAVTGDDDAMGPAAGAACTVRVPNQQLQPPSKPPRWQHALW